MSNNFDTCPYCGQKVLWEAMRCVKCKRILKTPEEQISSIQKLKESKKSFNRGKLFRYIILFLVIGFIYLFFSDQIVELIRSVIGE